MKVLFRVDASAAIGAGHLIRCFSLAQELRAQEHQVHWAMTDLGSAHVVRLRQEGIDLHRVPAEHGSAQDAEATEALVSDIAPDWVVLDGYAFGPQFQEKVAEAGSRIMYVDDYSHLDSYHCHALLNQNVYAAASMYEGKMNHPEALMLLASSYCLLRTEFGCYAGWKKPIKERAHRIYVSMGGADPDNVTQKVLSGLNRLGERLEIDIILGVYSPHIDSIREAADKSHHLVRVHVNPPDVPSLMADADLAFCAGGSTSWELAFMQLPTFMIYFAENQRLIAEGCDSAGFAENLGLNDAVDERRIAEAVQPLLEDVARREEMARSGRRLVDGLGAERVVEALR